MAYCPKCNGEMGQRDAVCPHCRYSFPPLAVTPASIPFRTQFSIRFLFFLIGLTAIVFSICSCLNDWVLVPALFVTGLLIWHARKVSYAVLPGLAIGFAVGLALNLAIDPIDKLGTGVWIATIGCPINAICKGFATSGLVALIVGIASTILVVKLTH